MSQVIVTEDRLKEKRQRSAAQEHRIATEEAFARFRRSDVTRLDPMARLLGFILMPLLGIGALIIWGVLEVVTQIGFRLLGRLFGGSRSLITSERKSY